MGRQLASAVLASLALCSAGCVRGCTSGRPPIHINPNMDDQPKLLPQASSEFFYDGAAMRVPVAGTVARGELQEDGALLSGKDAAGTYLAAVPGTVDDAVRARGAERYGIYCAPCHTDSGNGEGILFQRGKVPTTSLLDAKVRSMPDGQLYDVISNGFGLMPGYRWPVMPRDRWAIVVHVRALQAAAPPPAPAPSAAEAAPAAGDGASPVPPLPPEAPGGGTS